MSRDLLDVRAGVAPAGFERVAELVAASRSPETRRAYLASWGRFERWAAAAGVEALPAGPGVLARFVGERSRSSTVSTVRRDVAGIVAVHRAAGHGSPLDELARATLRGAAVRADVPGPGPSSPLRAADVRRIVEILDADLRRAPDVRAVRDRALILVGWVGALRRSELAALRWRDVEIVGQGVELSIRAGKGQRGRPAVLVGVARQRPPYCPVEALEALRAAVPSGPDEPLWPVVVGRTGELRGALSDRSIYARIVRLAKRAGVRARLGAHSIRSGALTEAAALGRAELSIADHARHASVEQTRRYIRPGSLWTRNPTHGLL